MAMITNIGAVDRIVRVALGIVLIGMAVSGTVGSWGYVGVVLVLTGAVRFCPLYRPLGVNTCLK